jgi:hypothetical protein
MSDTRVSGKKKNILADSAIGRMNYDEYQLFREIADADAFKIGSGHATQYKYKLSNIREGLYAVVDARLDNIVNGKGGAE